MLLFRPHCDDVVEIFGEPRKLECDACGAELELIADLQPVKSFKAQFDAVFGRRSGQGR